MRAAFVHRLESRDPDSGRGQPARDKSAPPYLSCIGLAAGLGSNTAGCYASVTAYVLTDRAVIDALREAAGRRVKVRIWRDANMAERVGDGAASRAPRSTQARLAANSCT
jgi:hypothetical protein